MDVQEGDVLEERYEIEASLGAGGFGSVFRAREKETGQRVAIKVLGYGEEYKARQMRFLQEIEILSELNHRM